MHNDALARYRGFNNIPIPDGQRLSTIQLRQAEATAALEEHPKVRSILWTSDGSLIVLLTEPLPSLANGIIFRAGPSKLKTLLRARRALVRRFQLEEECLPTDQLPDGYAMFGEGDE